MNQKGNGTSEGIFIIDFEKPYRILKTDSAFLQLLQYNADHFFRKEHYLNEIVQQDDYTDFVSSLSYQFSRSNSIHDKIRLIKASGKMCTVILDGELYTLENEQKVLKCTCSTTPTKEQINTSNGNSDLEVFSNSVRCGLSKHICNNNLSFVWTNDYYYKLFGYSKSEYIDHFQNSFIPLILEEDLPIVINAITNLIEEREIEIIFRIKHKTKPYKWVNLVAACIETETSHQFPIANFILNDISDLKYAEMHARLAAQKYEIISDISDEIPFDYEISTDTITFAKKYINIFEQKRIIHDPYHYFKNNQLVSPETFLQFATLFEAAKTNQLSYYTEFQLMNKNGDYEWYYANFSLLRNENGNPFRAFGLLHNIDAQKKELQSLLKQAQSDSMTGLLNKSTSEALAKQHLKEFHPGRFNAMMLIDIDDFKNINDTYGHLKGDEVIFAIANILTTHTANDGFVGRIGGDEFIVFLVNIENPTFACKKAETYASQLKEHFLNQNSQLNVTLSIGISVTEVPITYNDFLEQADIAVYQAKLNGKNGYSLYDPQLARSIYQNKRKEHFCNYDTDIIKNSISTLSENIDTKECIEEVIRYIGTTLKIDSILILNYDYNHSKLRKLLEWTSQKREFQNKYANTYAPANWEEIDHLTVISSYHSDQLNELHLFQDEDFKDIAEFSQFRFTYLNQTIGYINFFTYSKNWDNTKIETCHLFAKLLNASIQKLYLESKEI